jgi:hypothetical protein
MALDGRFIVFILARKSKDSSVDSWTKFFFIKKSWPISIVPILSHHITKKLTNGGMKSMNTHTIPALDH